MAEGFRRDLELAPGPGFRLRRRLGARIFSVLLALAALFWGAFDLWLGRWVVGALTLALAVAFVVQLVQAELDSWRFEGSQAVHKSWRGEQRIDRRRIAGVQIAFSGKRARAWIELHDGDQVPLVEGDAREVGRIADRLAALVVERPEVLH